MILTIILLAIFIVGILLNIFGGDYAWIDVGIFMWAIGGIFLMIHMTEVIMQSYNYNGFIVRKNSIQQTLEESRKSGSDLERAAVLQNVIDFNTSLANKQYNNSNWFFGTYIDDRIDSVKPIK